MYLGYINPFARKLVYRYSVKKLYIIKDKDDAKKFLHMSIQETQKEVIKNLKS